VATLLLVVSTPMLVRPAEGAQERQSTRFFTLRSVEPRFVHALLRPILDERLRVDVDQQTDPRGGPDTLRLAVAGPKDLVDAVARLVPLIDESSSTAGAPSRLDFYDASGLEDRIVSAAMQPLVRPFGDARYSIASGGLLTVYGPQDLHQRVVDTLSLVRRRLAELRANAEAEASDDEDADEAPGADRFVRLTWLGTQADDPVEDLGRSVSQDMRPVVRQLEALGLDGWRELGRTSVVATFGDEFRIQTGFTPAGTGRWQFRWEGFLQEWDEDLVRLGTQLRIDGTDGSSIDLSTTLEITPGKRVVLGLTPVADMHSAFVVELVEPDVD
jgi:hypothetical protein